jgi:hypothetical protein
VNNRNVSNLQGAVELEENVSPLQHDLQDALVAPLPVAPPLVPPPLVAPQLVSPPLVVPPLLAPPLVASPPHLCLPLPPHRCASGRVQQREEVWYGAVGQCWCQREQQRWCLVCRLARPVWRSGSCMRRAPVGLPPAKCRLCDEEPPVAAPWTMPPPLCAAHGAQLPRCYHGAARAVHSGWGMCERALSLCSPRRLHRNR